MKKFNLFLIFLIYVVSIFLYPRLPEQMPTHWNISGEIDSYMAKGIAIILFPSLSLFVFILFQVLPHLDPKKDKYRLFDKEWEIIQTGIIGFFSYLNVITLYVSLNPGTDILPLLFIGIGSLFVLIGNYLSKIRQNYFIGIKVPWTLSSEENWNKTHRFASWSFVIMGIVTIAEAYFLWFAPVVIFGGFFIAAGLPIVYSFLLFKKEKNNYTK